MLTVSMYIERRRRREVGDGVNNALYWPITTVHYDGRMTSTTATDRDVQAVSVQEHDSRLHPPPPCLLVRA